MTALVISEAHCSVEFHPAWPVREERGAEEGSVTQPVGDSGGSVFLHYGPASTLDAYIGGWRGRYGSSADVTAEGRILSADGLEGRSITLALDELARTRMGAPRAVTPPQTLVCTGYVIESVPVLLGYLVPRATAPPLVEAADRVLGSLRRAG